MARLAVKKSIKEKTENAYKKCKYCRTHRDARGFDKHHAACKLRFTIQNENRIVHNRAANFLVDDNTPMLSLPETVDDQTVNDQTPGLLEPSLDLAGGGNTPSHASGPTSIPQPSVAEGEHRSRSYFFKTT